MLSGAGRYLFGVARVHERNLFPTTGEPDGDAPSGGVQREQESAAPKRNLHRGRPSLPVLFQSASCPAGRNRRRIWIECEKRCADAQLRLIVDEALDATCERSGQDPYTPAVLRNVTINGKPTNDKDLFRWNNQVIGVRLGDLDEGTSVEVETDYQLSGDFSDLTEPSLRVEVFRTDQQADAYPNNRTGTEGEP